MSDEEVVERFMENAYHQYFCGMEAFVTSAPCASTELVHFRHRIGEESVELILKESVRVNLAVEGGSGGKDGRGRKGERERTAFIDTTVREKNVTLPTDSKLLDKASAYCSKAAKESGVKMRRSYVREIKGLKLVQRFRGRAHGKERVAKADRRMRVTAWRLVRELLRKLTAESKFRERLGLCLKPVNGEKVDGHKIYSLHEPDVPCIGKGKYKKYEFGNKALMVRLWNGLIVEALSFRNDDGHTLDRSMEQVGRIYGGRMRVLAGDRGYRGRERSGDTEICTPDVPKATDSACAREKRHRLFRKRAGIEPAIGHCKGDHRPGRNFYKGLFGDSVNVMPAAAAFNFKRAMRLLLRLVRRWLSRLLSAGESPRTSASRLVQA